MKDPDPVNRNSMPLKRPPAPVYRSLRSLLLPSDTADVQAGRPAQRQALFIDSFKCHAPRSAPDPVVQ